jgi:hypothetical protein
MHARSKAQQRAAGAALSVRRGDTPKARLKSAARDMAKSMSEHELEELASSSTKGKPEHVATSKQAAPRTAHPKQKRPKQKRPKQQ